MNADGKRMPTVYQQYIRVHPRLVLIRPHRSISPKIPRNRNGILVAQWRAIAFVPTKLGAWLTKGGEKNALDDFCNSFGAVVTRRGK
jgi:hypothetical protein